MKAITQDKYGSADVLRLRDVDEPTPGEHEVLVKVQAAGIARGVLHVMTGEPYLMRLVGFGLLKPKNPIPGQDVAGTVTAIGDGVTRFDVGDEIFGIAKGSFAEYTVAREDKLTHKPESLSFAQAAAMPISGLTARSARWTRPASRTGRTCSSWARQGVWGATPCRSPSAWVRLSLV